MLAASLIFLFGLLVGSFLNVLIWRLPVKEQVLRGRSHCRSCGQTIPWYDNVPLVSFALLKGRCRFCSAKIPWTYPLVELATGLLFLGVFLEFWLTFEAFLYAVLGAALIVISAIDLKSMIVPDRITMPGMQLGIIVSFFFPTLHGTASRWGGLIQSVAGALVGAGFLLVVGIIGSWIFKREAMGGGDIKLMAMVGTLLGPLKTLLVVLFLAPLIGSVVGLIWKFRYARDVIPYGPFLSLGSFLAIFWGEEMIRWYWKWIGL